MVSFIILIPNSNILIIIERRFITGLLIKYSYPNIYANNLIDKNNINTNYQEIKTFFIRYKVNTKLNLLLTCNNFYFAKNVCKTKLNLKKVRNIRIGDIM